VQYQYTARIQDTDRVGPDGLDRGRLLLHEAGGGRTAM